MEEIKQMLRAYLEFGTELSIIQAEEGKSSVWLRPGLCPRQAGWVMLHDHPGRQSGWWIQHRSQRPRGMQSKCSNKASTQ